MKIDMNTVLQDMDGSPMQDGPRDEDGKLRPDAELSDVTIRMIVQRVLTNQMKGDEELSPEDFTRNWNMNIDARGDEVDWTASQIEALQKRVITGYPNGMIGGQVCRILNG